MCLLALGRTQAVAPASSAFTPRRPPPRARATGSARRPRRRGAGPRPHCTRSPRRRPSTLQLTLHPPSRWPRELVRGVVLPFASSIVTAAPAVRRAGASRSFAWLRPTDVTSRPRRTQHLGEPRRGQLAPAPLHRAHHRSARLVTRQRISRLLAWRAPDRRDEERGCRATDHETATHQRRSAPAICRGEHQSGEPLRGPGRPRPRRRRAPYRRRLAHLRRARRAGQSASQSPPRPRVGPEVIVGLSAPRSPAMVVAILAILKSGGAYLPLDPGYPAERLAFMIEDARAPVLVTAGGAPAANGGATWSPRFVRSRRSSSPAGRWPGSRWSKPAAGTPSRGVSPRDGGATTTPSALDHRSSRSING